MRLCGCRLFVVALLACVAVAATVPSAATLCKEVQRQLNVSEPPPEACGVVIVSGGTFLSLRDHMATAVGVYGALRGYTGGGGGGGVPNASYEDVCSGATKHTEAVLVAFDLDQTTLRLLLDRWLDGHNPTVDGAYVGNYENASVPKEAGEPTPTTPEATDLEFYGAQYHSAFFARQPHENRVFRRAINARNLTVPRLAAFDGVFVAEVQPAAALLATRRRVPQHAQGVMLYQNRAAELRKGFVETDAAANSGRSGTTSDSDEDGVLQALDALDRDGKLAGAAAADVTPSPTTKKPKKARLAKTTDAPADMDPTTTEAASVPEPPLTSAAEADDEVTTVKPGKQRRMAKTTTDPAADDDTTLPVTDTADDLAVETNAPKKKRRTKVPRTTASASDAEDETAVGTTTVPDSAATTTDVVTTAAPTAMRPDAFFESDDGVDMLVAAPPTTSSARRSARSRPATTAAAAQVTNDAFDTEAPVQPSTKAAKRPSSMKFASRMKRRTTTEAPVAEDDITTTRAPADEAAAEAAPPPVAAEEEAAAE